MVTYRGLEFDPTPGRLDDVAAAADRLTAAADALAEVEPALRDAARHAHDWHGVAAEAFRARLTAIPGGLADRERALRAAAAVLDRWARTLAEHKRVTEDLDAAAVRLRARLRDAQDEVQDRQNALDLASTSAVAAGASIELSGARGRVADLESALAEVLDRARALERDHRRAADAAADELAVGTPEQAAPASRAVRAVAGVLATASATSATLAGLLAPPAPRTAQETTFAASGDRPAPDGPQAPPAAAAFADALRGGGPAGAGELIVFGETPLPLAGGHR